MNLNDNPTSPLPDAPSREGPPSLSFDLEEAILYAFLSEGRIPEGIREQLTPDIFSARYRPIARATLSIADRLGVCDIPSVADELNRIGYASIEMTQQLARLAEVVADSANLEIYIHLLRERAEAGDLHDDSPLARSGLSRLRASDDLELVKNALRLLADLLKGADPLTVAIERERAFRKLREIAVQSPGRLLDAVLPTSRGRTDETQQGRPILLQDPDPWPGPVDGAALLEEITALLQRFVVVPHGAAAAVALWIVFTYAIDEVATSPLLEIRSPVPECGKTVLLDTIALFVSRPLAAANVSPAAAFRVVEAHVPTLILDEGDVSLSDELRSIYNSGHTRDTAFVLRSAGDDHEPRQFSTWSPKVIALIGDLHRSTKSRAITVSMRKCTKAEGAGRGRPALERFKRNSRDTIEALRRRIMRWVNDQREAIREADPAMPEFLFNRDGDKWQPLLAIADAAGGPWPDRAREAAMVLLGKADDMESEVGVMLLGDLRAFCDEEKAERALSTDHILKHLHTLADRPWPKFGKRREPITAYQLARLLRPFEIRPGTVRPDVGPERGGTAKGYKLEELADTFARYLPERGEEEIGSGISDIQSVTSVTSAKIKDKTTISEPSQMPLVTDRKEGLTIGKHSVVTGVMDKNPESGETALPVGLHPHKDLDLLEVEFRALWRAIPKRNRLIAVDTWPDDVERFCRERGLDERVFAALEPRVRDLREGGRRRGRRDGRANLGASMPLFG